MLVMEAAQKSDLLFDTFILLLVLSIKSHFLDSVYVFVNLVLC